MSLTTPTTKEISDNIIAQLESSFSQTIPVLQKTFFRVLSKTLAGVFILLYKYGGRSHLDQFVQTASAKDTVILGVTINPLIFWGRLIGVGDPVNATYAELTINITVTTTGGTLPSGSQLVNIDNGVTYITIGAVSLATATVSATIRAVSDQTGGGGAGAIGNLNNGDIVSFANPLANVARNTVVTATTVTGADAEATEVYRQRVIDRFQKRPQGGAYSDYELWGEEVAGVKNIYPYTSTNPGQVDVYVEATDTVDGIPTTAQLQAVFDSIELDNSGLASRRPANALHNTFAIVRTPFDITVIGLVVDNPATVQVNITSAITEYFLERGPYIIGLSIPPRLDRITNSAVAGVVDDIISAAGGIFDTIVIKQSTITVDIYTLGIGEKAKSNSVTYI